MIARQVYSSKLEYISRAESCFLSLLAWLVEAEVFASGVGGAFARSSNYG